MDHVGSVEKMKVRSSQSETYITLLLQIIAKFIFAIEAQKKCILRN